MWFIKLWKCFWVRFVVVVVEMHDSHIFRFVPTDSKNHPILMHCLRGKIPCSCVTGCYRKVQQWSLTSIFDEYERYVGSLRPLDIQFLELFDVGELRDYDDSRRCRTGSSSTNSNKEGTWHDKKEDEEEEKDNEKKKEGD